LVYLYFVGKRVQKFLEELRSWCDQERGRQSEIAQAAGTTKQTVSNWFAERQEPTAEQLLAVMEYLEAKK
jgi:transcriptional regulator with XRE-family HTH domain